MCLIFIRDFLGHLSFFFILGFTYNTNFKPLESMSLPLEIIFGKKFIGANILQTDGFHKIRIKKFSKLKIEILRNVRIGNTQNLNFLLYFISKKVHFWKVFAEDENTYNDAFHT